MKRILIVAAHPDDEILGCGATVARLVQEGFEAYTLILGEGITARDKSRDSTKRKKEIIELKNQARRANRIIGIKDCFSFDMPDNRFDTVPMLDIVKIIEKVKKKIKPEIVFTHFWNDLNIDHVITYQAVITATRPLPEQPVKEIYCFETLSSTEWKFPLTFSPNVFYEVNQTIELKKKALQEYVSEIRRYPHPRSLRAIELNSEYWGSRIGVKNAEAFVCVRAVR